MLWLAEHHKSFLSDVTVNYKKCPHSLLLESNVFYMLHNNNVIASIFHIAASYRCCSV